jgi:aspartate kinase
VRILTDDAHTKARIREIDDRRLHADLEAGNVVVVAGFQGVDEHGNITTLGRGGSDTSAVALAAALKADECQIYTDVDGVYTTDPRIVDGARRLDRITFEEMLEMASMGSKVLQIRAVEFAGKYNVPLRVLHSFQDGPGTLISFEEDDAMETPTIAGIAFNRDEAKLTDTRRAGHARRRAQASSGRSATPTSRSTSSSRTLPRTTPRTSPLRWGVVIWPGQVRS